MRSGWRRRLVSGSRGVPSATASTSSALVSSRREQVGRAGRRCGRRPQITCPGSTSSRLATYRVRPASRTWLGAGSPSAGGHERRRRHRRLGQHRAVGEEGADPLAEAGVEDGDDEPQVGVELLGAQRGVEVAEVVLAQQGQGAGGRHVGGEEGLVVQLGPLDDPHAGQPGDRRAVAPLRRRHDHRDLLAVPERQLLDHPGGKRVVAAEHDVITAGTYRGIAGHGVILAGPSTHPKGVPAATAGPQGNEAEGECAGDGARGAPGGRPPGVHGRSEAAELRRAPGRPPRGRSGTGLLPAAGARRRDLDRPGRGQRQPHRARLVRARGDDPHLAGGRDGREGQGQPGRRRLGRAAHGDDRAFAPRTARACPGTATPRAPPGRCRAAARRTTAPRCGPRAGTASSSHRAYRAAAASGSSPSGPSDAGIGCTRSGLASTWSSSAARAPVSLRSGMPGGRKRSSPHQMSRCRQSTASLAGAAASSASTCVPMPPPVSTSEACPRAAEASTSRSPAGRPPPWPAAPRPGGSAPGRGARWRLPAPRPIGEPGQRLAVDLVRGRAGAAPRPAARPCPGGAARRAGPAGRACQRGRPAVRPADRDVAVGGREPHLGDARAAGVVPAERRLSRDVSQAAIRSAVGFFGSATTEPPVIWPCGWSRVAASSERHGVARVQLRSVSPGR